LAIFQPFRALRAPRNTVHLVASRSYITYSRSGLTHKLSTNPYSFVNIINPEFGKKKRTKPNSSRRFELVKEKFEDFLSRGIFKRDAKPAFYLYRQTHLGKVFTGLIGANHCEDYENGLIRKHEHTLVKREQVFEKYLEITGINAEPVLLTHPDSQSLEQHYARLTQSRPEYDFMTANGTLNELWIIDKKEDIEAIHKEFSGFKQLYIADGHHRCASSALLSKTMREQNKNHTGKEAYNYFLSYIIPEHNLEIKPFTRLVTTLDNFSPSTFIEKLKETFEVIPLQNEYYHNTRYNSIAMYLDKCFYELRSPKYTYDATHPVERLDVSILSTNILQPLLGIKDPRTDSRIFFEGGETPPAEIIKAVDQGKYKAAFFMHPISMEQLKAVADAGLYMPPKSTWIEPKLRSGLILFVINDEHL
jgi:uncharacterized protein (DUF1015 family)